MQPKIYQRRRNHHQDLSNVKHWPKLLNILTKLQFIPESLFILLYLIVI